MLTREEKWLLIGLGAVLGLLVVQLALALRGAAANGMLALSGQAMSFGEGELYYPRGVKVSPGGDIYVADSGNCRICRYSAAGRLLKSWGQQGSGPGQFKEPGGLAIDAEGNVLVADTWNGRLQRFRGDGKFIDEWTAPDGMYGPRDVVVDGFGQAYVSDTGKHRVLKFSQQGRVINILGGEKSSRAGAFNEPFGLAVDGHNELYVLDRLNFRWQLFDRQGNLKQQMAVKAWSQEQYLVEPYIAVDGGGGLIYISDPPGGRLLKYNLDGALLGECKNDEQGRPYFSKPVGVAVGQDGKIYVSDVLEHRVVVLTSAMK